MPTPVHVEPLLTYEKVPLWKLAPARPYVRPARPRPPRHPPVRVAGGFKVFHADVHGRHTVDRSLFYSPTLASGQDLHHMEGKRSLSASSWPGTDLRAPHRVHCTRLQADDDPEELIVDRRRNFLAEPAWVGVTSRADLR